jgi:hypothetical protein
MDNNTENQNQEQAQNPVGELNGQQALNVLIAKAIKVFVPPTPAGEEGTETDPVVNKDEEATEETPAEPVMTKVGE